MKDMTDRLTASCHCGGVALDFSADAIGVVCCHCTDCRKMHGNYNAMLAVPVDDIRFSAVETLTWYKSSDKARRGFCSHCGGRMFKENLGSGKYMLSAGTVDDATGKHIIRNLFVESKGDWYSLPEAVT